MVDEYEQNRIHKLIVAAESVLKRYKPLKERDVEARDHLEYCIRECCPMIGKKRAFRKLSGRMK
jgi:hypothetical protein